MRRMSLKDQPELRHFLSHVLLAIEELANGHKAAAIYEIRSIESLVSWSGDDGKFRRFCSAWKGKHEEKEKALPLTRRRKLKTAAP